MGIISDFKLEGVTVCVLPHAQFYRVAWVGSELQLTKFQGKKLLASIRIAIDAPYSQTGTDVLVQDIFGVAHKLTFLQEVKHVST